MTLSIGPDGTIRCVYDDAIDLSAFGSRSIQRASHVEPDELGQWWADLSPVNGPRLGPFIRRIDALTAESHWLETHWLFGSPQNPGLPDVGFRIVSK